MKISDSHIEFYHHPDDIKYAFHPEILKGQISPKVINKTKPDLLFLAIFSGPDKNQWHKLFSIVNIYKQEITRNNWQLVLNKEDLKSNKIKIILHLEGLPRFNGKINKLEGIFDLGIRSVGLTHDQNNEFAASCFSPNKGLTKFGLKVVREILQKGMILDFAHLSPKAIGQIIANFKFRPFLSHGAVAGIYDDLRNSNDKVLGVIKEGDGFMGVGFAGSMIKQKNAKIDDLLKHIIYLEKKIGRNRVGIGSDFGGIDTYLIQKLSNFEKINKLVQFISNSNFFSSNLKDFVLRSNLLDKKKIVQKSMNYPRLKSGVSSA